MIPALNPGNSLTTYVDTLISKGYGHILVIDDGSRDEFRPVFDALEKKTECTILRHGINLGKGRALKDAMKYYLENFSGSLNGMITVDSDGQHTVPDVDKVAHALDEHPLSLVLGARDFATKNVPWKSSFGNKCTRIIMKLFIGGDIHDTQTGLRGIPNSLIERYSDLTGDRFEYETVMLMDAIRSKTPITEVTIETVYIDGNSETHFHPVIDSFKIYRVILGTFLKYLLSSLSSFVVDYGIFCALVFILQKTDMTQSRLVWISTAIARICSSLFNYTVNRNVVFQSKRGNITILMYYTLCIAQAACSAALVSLIGSAHLPVQWAKILVDSILFMISYRIQKSIIFR